MNKINNKAQVGALTPNIVGLVVAVIVLVMGLIIVAELRDADIVSASQSQNFTNQTLITVTETGESLSCGAFPAGSCNNVSFVINASSGTVIPGTNYTQNNCVLNFTTGNTQGFNNSNWNVTYGCTFGDTVFTSTNTSLVGLGTFADFIPIIVIAVAASVIIGLILLGFAFTRRER